MTDLDTTILHEVWCSIKDEIPEKAKIEVAKEMLTTLEDHAAVSYDTLMELKRLDKHLKEAVDLMYKEDDEEDPFLTDDY